MSGIVVLHGEAYAYEELNLGDDAAHGVTASNLYTSTKQPAKYALVTVSANTINFRLDGTAPLTTTGHIMVSGTSYVIEGHENIKNFKAINAVGSADGVVRITFFTRG